jgi:CubicO group peptidase (beta-lactamase class C family)
MVQQTAGTSLRRRLDDVIARHRSSEDAPSIVLVIESLDGRFRWEAGAGPASVADRSEIAATSPYFAASITKLFVAILVMQLRARGRVRLDTPLVDVVPYDLTRLHVLGGVDRTASMTVGQALSHTTGLPNYLEDSPWRSRSLLGEALVSDRAWGVPEVIERSRDVLRPRFAPGHGRRAHYSDTNYQLLGAAIEHITGEPLGSAIQAGITAPIGTTATRLFDSAHHDIDAVATIFDADRALRHPLLMTSVSADGGIVTTADDSLLLLRAWLDGDLISDADRASMQETWRRIFLPFRYGLGIMQFRLPRVFTGMRSMEMIGHSGASGALAFVVPAQGLLITGTVNQLRERSTSFKLALRLLGEVASELG